jgi:hypothetical protein
MNTDDPELEALELQRTAELVYLRQEKRRLRDLETWHTACFPVFDHDYLVWARDEHLLIEPCYAIGELRNGKWKVAGMSQDAEVLAWTDLIAQPYDLNVALWRQKQETAKGQPSRYIWQLVYTPPGKQQAESVFGYTYWHDDAWRAAEEAARALKPHEWQSMRIEIMPIGPLTPVQEN